MANIFFATKFIRKINQQFASNKEKIMLTILENSNKQSVNLQLLKSYLRIEYDDEDKDLRFAIETATGAVEHLIGKSIMRKKYEYTSDGLRSAGQATLDLPMGPVIQIESAIYKTTHQAVELLDQSLDRIRFSSRDSPVTITYLAGMYENPDHVPPDMKFAIMQVAKNIYEGKDDIFDSKYINIIANTYRNYSII
jgi:uncharacterized phiE125 gp8 family phage protein